MQEGKKMTRNIFITQDINEDVSNVLIRQIEKINRSSNKTDPIKLYIANNGRGGNACHTMRLVDAMRCSRVPVYTYSIGVVCSASFIVFIHGERRYCDKNSLFVTHATTSINNEDASRGDKLLVELITARTQITKEQWEMETRNYFKEWFIKSNEAIHLCVAEEMYVLNNRIKNKIKSLQKSK
jgi:ATP-dependent protease ClpP protease subunit